MFVTVTSLSADVVLPQLDSDNLYFEIARMKPIKVPRTLACFANEESCTIFLFGNDIIPWEVK